MSMWSVLQSVGEAIIGVILVVLFAVAACWLQPMLDYGFMVLCYAIFMGLFVCFVLVAGTALLEGSSNALQFMSQMLFRRPLFGGVAIFCITSCIVFCITLVDQLPAVCHLKSPSESSAWWGVVGTTVAPSQPLPPPAYELGLWLIWRAPFVFFTRQYMPFCVLTLISLSLLLFGGCVAPTPLFYVHLAMAIICIFEARAATQRLEAEEHDQFLTALIDRTRTALVAQEIRSKLLLKETRETRKL